MKDDVFHSARGQRGVGSQRRTLEDPLKSNIASFSLKFSKTKVQRCTSLGRCQGIFTVWLSAHFELL